MAMMGQGGLSELDSASACSEVGQGGREECGSRDEHSGDGSGRAGRVWFG